MDEKNSLKGSGDCAANAGFCCGNCSGCPVNTGSCGKGCGSCCSANFPLSTEERQLLERFAELPFLPVIWNDAEQRIHLLESGLPEEKAESALFFLLNRRYADIDLTAPLKDYPYGSHPDCQFGSVALTALGQDALDDLEYGRPHVLDDSFITD